MLSGRVMKYVMLTLTASVSIPYYTLVLSNLRSYSINRLMIFTGEKSFTIFLASFVVTREEPPNEYNIQ